MINAKDIWSYLKLKDYTFFSGVPCSILKEILEVGMNDSQISYIPAVRENAALGVASGAYLAGRRSGILVQNSGLGNIINGLTSFNIIYKIPILMFISWRGFGGKDAPEHLIMGRKMLTLLKDLQIPYRILTNAYRNDLNWAIKTMERESMPVAIIIKKGQIE